MKTRALLGRADEVEISKLRDPEVCVGKPVSIGDAKARLSDFDAPLSVSTLELFESGS